MTTFLTHKNYTKKLTILHKRQKRSSKKTWLKQINYDLKQIDKDMDIHDMYTSHRAGVLKLWVATRRWVAEALQVGHGGLTSKKFDTHKTLFNSLQ